MKNKVEIVSPKMTNQRTAIPKNNKPVRVMSSFFWGVRRCDNILVSERNIPMGTMPYKKAR